MSCPHGFEYGAPCRQCGRGGVAPTSRPGTEHGVRSAGEAIRARHTIANLRASLDSIEQTLDGRVAPDPGTIQAVVFTAVDLGNILSKLDAYTRVEKP